MGRNSHQHADSNHEQHGDRAPSEGVEARGSDHGGHMAHGDLHGGGMHGEHMAAQFARLFWISLALSIPVLVT